jgi:hypothetical protein
MEGKRIDSIEREQAGSSQVKRCGEKARVSDDLHFDQAASSRPVGWGWPHCSLVTTHGPWRGLACRTIEFRAKLTKRTRRCGAHISCSPTRTIYLQFPLHTSRWRNRQIRKPVFDLSEEHRDLRLS